jgi:hypothetical protein
MKEAEASLIWQNIPWPSISDDEEVHHIKTNLKMGQLFFPVCFVSWKPAQVGALGANPMAPRVQSRRTSQEKLPWKRLPSLRGNVEKEFSTPSVSG